MTRVGIGSIMVAVGYLLAFAGIHNKGQYALRPWDALGA